MICGMVLPSRFIDIDGPARVYGGMRERDEGAFVFVRNVRVLFATMVESVCWWGL